MLVCCVISGCVCVGGVGVLDMRLGEFIVGLLGCGCWVAHLHCGVGLLVLSGVAGEKFGLSWGFFLAICSQLSRLFVGLGLVVLGVHLVCHIELAV